LVPISIVARKARRVQTHHQTSLAQADLRDQRLKTVTITAGGARFAKVVIDDMNPLARPAEEGCSLDKAILQLSALLMLAAVRIRA
jgi:hypothetical protein